MQKKKKNMNIIKIQHHNTNTTDSVGSHGHKPSPPQMGRSLQYLALISTRSAVKTGILIIVNASAMCYRRGQPRHAVVTCVRFFFRNPPKKRSADRDHMSGITASHIHV